MELQTKRELETLEDLFDHDGWKLLKEDFKRILDAAIQNADVECKNNDDWQFRRGVITELKYFLNYENLVRGLLENA